MVGAGLSEGFARPLVPRQAAPQSGAQPCVSPSNDNAAAWSVLMTDFDCGLIADDVDRCKLDYQ
jgi:hypothetical protein